MRPARLDVAQTEHCFGLRDSRSTGARPDARRAPGDGDERPHHRHDDVLGQPPGDDAVLGAARPTGSPRSAQRSGLTPCTFEDRYFTADFPGWATRIVEDELGGEALYFNGAIGDLITPLGANVWEVDERRPARRPVSSRPPVRSRRSGRPTSSSATSGGPT